MPEILFITCVENLLIKLFLDVFIDGPGNFHEHDVRLFSSFRKYLIVFSPDPGISNNANLLREFSRYGRVLISAVFSDRIPRYPELNRSENSLNSGSFPCALRTNLRPYNAQFYNTCFNKRARSILKFILWNVSLSEAFWLISWMFSNGDKVKYFIDIAIWHIL